MEIHTMLNLTCTENELQEIREAIQNSRITETGKIRGADVLKNVLLPWAREANRRTKK